MCVKRRSFLDLEARRPCPALDSTIRKRCASANRRTLCQTVPSMVPMMPAALDYLNSVVVDVVNFRFCAENFKCRFDGSTITMW
jgi:hypothetical protein